MCRRRYVLVTGVKWFPDKDIQRTAPAQAQVHLRRKDQETVELEGSIGFKAQLTCDCSCARIRQSLRVGST